MDDQKEMRSSRYNSNPEDAIDGVPTSLGSTVINMLTYSLLEQILIKLGYAVDFDLRYHAKLTAFIPVDGYDSEIELEFREGYTSELGDRKTLLQLEWVMADGESCLVLDSHSLDHVDQVPHVFATEKLILRKVFDQILLEIAQVSDSALRSNPDQ